MAKKKAEAESIPDDNAPPPDGDDEPRTTLFPEADVPKDIKKLALAMKTAELERKRQQVLETDARLDLCFAMGEAGIDLFQLEVDGIDYQFEHDITERVKSRKVKKDEE